MFMRALSPPPPAAVDPARAGGCDTPRRLRSSAVATTIQPRAWPGSIAIELEGWHRRGLSARH